MVFFLTNPTVNTKDSPHNMIYHSLLLLPHIIRVLNEEFVPTLKRRGSNNALVGDGSKPRAQTFNNTKKASNLRTNSWANLLPGGAGS